MVFPASLAGRLVTKGQVRHYSDNVNIHPSLAFLRYFLSLKSKKSVGGTETRSMKFWSEHISHKSLKQSDPPKPQTCYEKNTCLACSYPSGGGQVGLGMCRFVSVLSVTPRPRPELGTKLVSLLPKKTCCFSFFIDIVFATKKNRPYSSPIAEYVSAWGDVGRFLRLCRRLGMKPVPRSRATLLGGVVVECE